MRDYADHCADLLHPATKCFLRLSFREGREINKQQDRLLVRERGMIMSDTMQKRVMKAAERFLTHRGYDVLETEWEAPNDFGTIDLVASDDDTLVFAEVTYRVGEESGFAVENTDLPEKRERVEKLAASWLSHQSRYVDVSVRFDIISFLILGDDKAMVRHHIGAFS